VNMIFACLSVLEAIAVTLVAALPGLGASAAEPNPAELRIEIFGFGGFHVLTNRTKLFVSRDRYAIDMDLDTRNIAALFVDLSSHSEVRGRLIGDAVHPDAYQGDVRRNGTERLYRIDYGRDGMVASDQTPPSPALRSSAAVDQMRGTVDQLTAFFILERQLAQHGTCALVLRVFDGLALYNLRFTDAQPGTLPPNGRQRFAGPTQACDVNREDVAGFPGNGDQAAGTYSEGKIWYAPNLVSGRIVPVRMRFETEFGRVEGYLAELRDSGVDRQFMD
jgi:Protein of unknown function (DUF3108)